MKVNYVLMYGTPYLKYGAFEKFDDISKYLINKKIVNYTIYEQMEDLKEVEMIHLNNDIHVLENRINKAIEYINNCLIGYKEQYEELTFNYHNVSYDLENISEILKGD